MKQVITTNQHRNKVKTNHKQSKYKPTQYIKKTKTIKKKKIEIPLHKKRRVSQRNKKQTEPLNISKTNTNKYTHLLTQEVTIYVCFLLCAFGCVLYCLPLGLFGNSYPSFIIIYQSYIIICQSFIIIYQSFIIICQSYILVRKIAITKIK